MLANVGIYLTRLGLVFWLGEMLFFIAIFAPRVFKILPREMAGQLQGAIFPAYYFAGIICAIVVAVGFALRYFGMDATLPRGNKAVITGVLWTVAFVVFIYSYKVLTPEIDALRVQMHATPTPTPELQASFDVLHKLSVRVNSAALFALLGLLAFI